MLVNNNYSTFDIDHEIRAALNDYLQPTKMARDPNLHILYYKNQMSTSYKLDERVLKHILKANVTPTESNNMTLRIYYRSRHTSNLVMRNNQNKTISLKSTNIVYKFTCPHEDCQPQEMLCMLCWSHNHNLIPKIDVSQAERRTEEAHERSP